MKAFVLDASMAIEWFITAGEDDAPVNPAIMDDHAVVVPYLWRSEILNWLASSVRSGRITEMEAVHTAAEILSWPTMTGDDHDPSAILRLCREHSLTAYDATYLHLALAGGWPLATLDRDLRVAAEKLGVTLV